MNGVSRVAIINKTIATKFFPNEDPIGKHIQVDNGSEHYREIIGIVGDVKHEVGQKEDWPEIYEPYTEQPYSYMTVVIRTLGDPSSLSNTIRKEV